MEHTSTTSAPVVPTHTHDVYGAEKLRLEKIARRSGDDNTMWELAHTSPWSLATRFSMTDKTGDDLVPDLHFLWFLYYQGSKNTTATSPAQQRLALQVVQLQGKGALSRRRRGAAQGSGAAATEIAMTADGALWTELPFLVSDMTEFWTNDCAAMSAAQRVNFSHFLALLTSTSVARDRLAGIALTLFRDALETPRALGDMVMKANTQLNTNAVEGDDDGNKTKEEQEVRGPAKSLADLTVGDLLPAVQTWLLRAGTKLIQLSDDRWQDCPAEARAIGALYRDDAQTSLKASSFSPERWIYWLRRLEQIARDAKEQSLESLAELATKAMDHMLIQLYESWSEVRSEFEAAPDVVEYRNPLWQMYLGDMYA